MTKLSQAQARVLRAMSAPAVKVIVATRYVTGARKARFLGNDSESVRIQTVRILERKGFVENISTVRWRSSVYQITDAGREAVAGYQFKPVPELVTVYVASFRGGDAALSHVEARETPKLYRVESCKDLIGRQHIRQRVVKDGGHCFDTKCAALVWLQDQAVKHVRHCQAAMAKARSQVVDLGRMVEESA